MNIQESIHHILGLQPGLVDRFYPRFLTRCPEARRLFEGTDLRRQALMLTAALLYVERLHAGGYAVAEHYLRYLGTRHHMRGIPRELYPPFAETLLGAVADLHGPDWDDKLAAEWRAALDRAVKAMLEGYDSHFTV